MGENIMSKPTTAVTENPYFTMQGDTMVITHSSGFFSNCTIALYAISAFHGHFQRLPERVDFSRSFKNFSEPNSGEAYPKYFTYKHDMEISFTGKIQMSFNSLFDYRQEQYSKLAPFVEKYFSPSNEVQSIADQLTDKYNIDFSNTLAICYRGTDKYMDTPLGPFPEYVEQARVLLKQEPNLNILVQTDQKQFLDYCKQELENVFSIEEMPVTDTNSPMHDIVQPEAKTEWTRTFVAVTGLLSRCKYVVNHSGNVARWICLYRNNTKGVVQYFKPRDLPKGAPGDFWCG